MPKLPKKKQCTGCMACIDSCARHAIKVCFSNGHSFPKVELDKCVDCKLCEKHCPVLHPKNQNNAVEIEVRGGWCTDQTVRLRSASGGAFAGFAMSVFEKGGLAIGASLNDDNSVEHKVITKIEDLPKLQNSKYVQSNTIGIYNKTKELLKQGEFVLFSGTPCQVAALNSFLGRKWDNLITVDVVCNGIPSKEAIEVLLGSNTSKRIISFRDKEFGWHALKSQKTVYRDPSGKVISSVREKDPFYKVFSCGLTHRQVCCNCPFSVLPRYSDITIADFWGIKRFAEEWNDGISLIIANNKKATQFLKECQNIFLFDSSLNECLKANPRLVNGVKYHSLHPIMLWRSKLRHLIGETVYQNIIMNKYPYKLLWGGLKVLTIVSNKFAVKRALKYDKENRNHNYIQGE